MYQKLSVWLTFGLVMTSIVSSASLIWAGIWVQTRYWSHDWAPGNIRPPPTTTIQLYILFFISSESYHSIYEHTETQTFYTDFIHQNSSKWWKKYSKTNDLPNIQIRHHTQRRLRIKLSFLCASCSLGILKLNINWHSQTIFISLVQHSFIKKLIYGLSRNYCVLSVDWYLCRCLMFLRLISCLVTVYLVTIFTYSTFFICTLDFIINIYS